MIRTLIVLAVFTHPAMAQDEAGTPQPAASPGAACASEMHRQFDFWIGEWAVTTGDQPAGSNRIERRHKGCVLAEHWTSANGGFTGSSINIYDAATGRWHQTWADSSGTLLLLEGGFHDGQMVLEGTRPGTDDGRVRHRISWTPLANGTVRQHWESRRGDDGWTTLFDGIYHRAEAKK